MTYAGRHGLAAFALALITLSPLLASSARANTDAAERLAAQPKYAAIVVDANSGEVLYAKRADAQRFPASITKVMTLYLTFEGLATGRLSLDERIIISPHAFSMQPSKIASRPGESLTVAQAIQAVTVHSANDVAVALAERLGGTEQKFAELMTLRAQELGMTNTRFVNASGLPDTRQVSSARDIALLSRAVMRDYPQYYGYFGAKSFNWHGKLLLNHNHLVARMPGVDGLKTGYTAAAGFNLAASAVRDGRRLITVVLGGPSTAARDENVEELLTAGFDVLDRRSHGQKLTLASVVAAPDDMSGPVMRAPVEEGSAEQPDLKVVVQPQVRMMPMLAAARALTPSLTTRLPTVNTQAEADETCGSASRKQGRRRRRSGSCGRRVAAAAPAKVVPHAEKAESSASRASNSGGYLIQVGAYHNRSQAKDHLDKVSDAFGKVVADASPEVDKARGNYRVRFRGLTERQAKAACRVMSGKGQTCMVMGES